MRSASVIVGDKGGLSSVNNECNECQCNCCKDVVHTVPTPHPHTIPIPTRA
jgi:hypothetical protein